MVDNDKIPVVLLCGFLGSGKTTLLSKLLTCDEFSGKNIAVLVNDFGSLPVDSALLPQGDYYLTEINKGNIFCVCVKTDLLKNLETIANEINPDILLIEATGVAEPGDFTSLLQTEQLKKRFIKATTVCIADALNFMKLSKGLPALAAQVKVADLIVINKIDLASESEVEKIEQTVTELNPEAEIQRAVYGNIPVSDELIKPSRNSCQGLDDSFELLDGPPEYAKTYEYLSETPVDKRKFYDFLHDERHNILRAKGTVEFDDGSFFFIEIVNGVVNSRPAKGISIDSGSKSAITFFLRNHISGFEI